jgi:hypothetical protein
MTNEVRIVDPKTGGEKGQKSERYDLLPFDALDELARVYGEGAKKYDDDNWLKGYAWRLSYGALLRHVSRSLQGEDVDPETGCSHLAHAAWHCLTLLTFKKRGLGTDDRKPPIKKNEYSVTIDLVGHGYAELFKALEKQITDTLGASVVDAPVFSDATFAVDAPPVNPPLRHAFKVGDRVECIDDYDDNACVGQLGTIVELREDDDADYRVVFDGEDRVRWTCMEGELAPAEIEEPFRGVVENPRAFKAGDSVRCIEECCRHEGQVGVMYEDDGDNVAQYWVRFEDGETSCYNERDLERRAFKAGDKVRILVASSLDVPFGSSPLVGRIVTITRDDGDDEGEAPWRVSIDGSEYCLNASEIEAFDGTFKPGDRVKETKAYASWEPRRATVLAMPDGHDRTFPKDLYTRAQLDGSWIGVWLSTDMEPA